MRLLLLALLLAPSLARAGDGLLDPRLGEPGAFGRYADTAKTRSGDVPVAVPADGPSARRPVQFLAFQAQRRNPGARIPSPFAVKAPKTAEPLRLPKPNAPVLLLGLAAVAAAMWSGRPRPMAAKLPGKVSVPEPLTLPPPTPPARRTPPPLALPGPTPAPRPKAPEPQALPWWIITDAESDAMARWNLSAEKERLAMSLEDWLERNRHGLKGVDVDLLRRKLDRSA